MKGISVIANSSNYQLITEANKYIIESIELKNLLGKPEHGSMYNAQADKIIYGNSKSVFIKQISKKSGLNENLIKQEIAAMKIVTEMEEINLLPLIDSFEDKDYFYLITPHCNKGSLSSFIEAKNIGNESTAIEYFRQICSGVCALHSKKITLKGLRTDDIFVNEVQGRSYLIISDYGLSRSIDSISSVPKDLKLLCIRAPEVFMGVRGVEEDIFALGCIYYKMLCGKEYISLSTEGDIKKLQITMSSMLVNSEWKLSETSLSVLEGCLQYDYKQRITMKELSELLELDNLYTNDKPLNLEVKSHNNLISTKARARKDAKTMDFIQVIDTSHTPIKVIEKRENSEIDVSKSIVGTHDVEVTKLRQELEIIKSITESLKKKQEKFDVENQERTENSTVQKIELESLKKEILGTKFEISAPELKEIKNKMYDLQEKVNEKNKIFLDYMDSHKGSSDEIIKMHNTEVNKMQVQYSTQIEALNLKYTQQVNDNKGLIDSINAQNKEISDIKKTIALMKVDSHTNDFARIQSAYSQLQEIVNQKFNTHTKQLAEMGEKQKSDSNEFRKALTNSLSIDSYSSDINSLKVQIVKIAEELNNKVSQSTKDFKDVITKSSTEFSEIKKQIITEAKQTHQTATKDIEGISAKLTKSGADSSKQLNDTVSTLKQEIEALKASIASMQEADTQKFNKINGDAKSLIGYIELQKQDITELKKSLTSFRTDTLPTELNKTQSQINQILDDISQGNAAHAKDIEELKKALLRYESFSLDIGKLHTQIEEINSSISIKVSKSIPECKVFCDFVNGFKLELAEIKKSIAVMKSEPSNEITKVQTQIYQIQENINLTNSKGNAENKAMIEELKKAVIALRSESYSAELSKLQEQINDINQCLNQKDTTYANEYKSTYELIDKQKQEMIEIKTQSIKHENYALEVSKLATFVNTMNDGLTAKIAKGVNESKAFVEFMNSCKLEIAELRKALGTIKSESSLTVEINRLQSQINQLQANLDQRNNSFTKESKVTVDVIEMNKSDIAELKKLYSSIKPDALALDISKLQAQINSLQESFTGKVNKTGADYKQLIEFIDSQKMDIIELKKAIALISRDNTAGDIAKLHTLVFQLQETVNQKLITQNRDYKSLVEIIEKLRNDFEDGKKANTNIKTEAIIAELNKYQTQTIQFQDSVNQKLASYLKESKSLTEHADKYDKLRLELAEAKKSADLMRSEMVSTAELIKLQTQIGQLQDSINGKFSTISITFNKQITDFIDLQKVDADQFKKRIEAIESSTRTSSSELANIRSKIYELQENLNQRLAFHIKENKSMTESSEKLKTDIVEMRRSMYSVKSTDINVSDINKLTGQLYQLQESVNQRLTIFAKEAKNLSEITNSLKIEIVNIKKEMGQYEGVSPDMTKLQALVCQLQESVNQKIIKRTEGEKQITEDMQVQRTEIAQLKQSISNTHVSPNNSSEELTKLKEQILQLQQTLTAKEDKSAEESKSIHTKQDLLKGEIDEIRKSISTMSTHSDEELIKVQTQFTSFQETFTQKISVDIATNVKQTTDAMEIHKKDIEEMKKSIALLKADTSEIIKIKTQLKTMQDSIDSKLATATQEIQEIKTSIGNQEKQEIQAKNETKAIKAEITTLTQNITNYKADITTIIAKFKSYEAQLENVNKSITIVKSQSTEIHTYEQNINALVVKIESLKQTFDNIANNSVILEIISRINALETLLKQSTSPKKDANFHYFKTLEKVIMKLELVDTKFKITDINNILKDEININEISLLKMDDVNRCVNITRKAPISPAKPLPTGTPIKSIFMQLFEDTLPDTIELYKFIRNAHLMKSEKKMLLASSP